MKKLLLLWAIMACITAVAQDHVLRIPYSAGKSIYGIISRPASSGAKHGVAIISHGFNGTHHFGRDYFRTLNDLGYAVYTFDFPCGSVNSQITDNIHEDEHKTRHSTAAGHVLLHAHAACHQPYTGYHRI